MEELAIHNEDTVSEIGKLDKAHPWRLCPLGKHYVREHKEHIPPSKKHPTGETIIRHAHCANNPLRQNGRQIKDVMLFDELQIITKTQFSLLEGAPTAKVLKYPRADEFDELIRGWVSYWNEVYEPKYLLDPNLVKALIASESSFNPDIINYKNPPEIGPARGLMQITEKTLRILHAHEDELRNHFVFLSHENAMNPSANICAGTRWLFQKRAVARERYAKIDPDHIVTWEDAVAEYKGVLGGILDDDNKHPDPENKMDSFLSIYENFLE